MNANRIWHEAAKLPDFKLEIAGIIAGLMLLVLALPLLPVTLTMIPLEALIDHAVGVFF